MSSNLRGKPYQSVLFGSSRPVNSTTMASLPDRDLYPKPDLYFKPVMASTYYPHTVFESAKFPSREDYVREIKPRTRPNLNERAYLEGIKTVAPFKMLAHDETSHKLANKPSSRSRGFEMRENCRPLAPILFVEDVTQKSARAQQEKEIMSEKKNQK